MAETRVMMKNYASLFFMISCLIGGCGCPQMKICSTPLIVNPFLTPTFRDGNVCCNNSSGPIPPGPSDCCFSITKVIRNVDFTLNGQLGAPTVKSFIITTPGTYLFGEPILYQGSAGNTSAIVIASNDVTLNLNGYGFTASTSFAQRAVEILPSLSNIVVMNGTINLFNIAGISNPTTTPATTDNNISVRNLTVTNNGIGIDLQNIDLILDSIAATLNTTYGIRLQSVVGGGLSRSIIAKNGVGVYASGLNTFNFSQDTINNNTMSATDPGALMIFDSTTVCIDSSCILNNSATTSAVDPTQYAGLYVSGSTDVRLNNSRIEDNNANGLIAGAYFTDSSAVTILYDMIRRNGISAVIGTGILLNNTPRTFIQHNTVAYETIGIRDTATASSSTIINNTLLYNTTAFSITYSIGGVDIVGQSAGLQPGDFIPLQSKTDSQNVVINNP